MINTWKEFKDKFGEDTTTNIQLIQIAKALKIPNFYYVMRDEMGLLPKDKKPLYVMTNIHTSKEKGVHHSCFYKETKGDLNKVTEAGSYFFDSYGLPPTKEVEKFMGSGICSTFKIQEDGTRYCGQMSLYVLHRLNQGDKFTDIVLSLYQNEL